MEVFEPHIFSLKRHQKKIYQPIELQGFCQSNHYFTCLIHIFKETFYIHIQTDIHTNQ